jgi:hypothetical protein
MGQGGIVQPCEGPREIVKNMVRETDIMVRKTFFLQLKD